MYIILDGGYTVWVEWSECSATCDGGVQVRTRSCTKPAPKNGGKNCSSAGPAFESRKCNVNSCPGKMKSQYVK